jgi:hypothetical protein
VALVISRSIFGFLRLRGRLLSVYRPFVFGVPLSISALVGRAENPADISQGTPPPELKSQIGRPASERATGADLVEAVRRVVANVRETSYRHQLRVDPANGIYELDCSEFVSLILERVAPKRYQEIFTEPGHPQPRARMYFRFFEQLKHEPRTGWQPITKLAEAAPGDLIAWEKPDNGGLGDTGHVMIVAEPPEVDPDGTFEVRVYDSSEIPHAEDSRAAAGKSGVGSGSIHFRVDADGAPIAFQFNPRSQWHSEPIAIARLKPD